MESVSEQNDQLTLTPHRHVHTSLNYYTDLMKWLKNMDHNSFKALSQVYTSNMARIYDRQIKSFFELAKQKMSPQLPEVSKKSELYVQY